MPQQVATTVQNNFMAGLKTQFTGLNFPENASTDTDNCTYTLVGDVTRRFGIDYEQGFQLKTIDRTNKALSDYKWNNVGGDGLTQFLVQQVGTTLFFYNATAATISNPLSKQVLSSTINLLNFLPIGSPNTTISAQQECQYSDANGYLFVFHPSLDPFYVTFNSSTNTVSGSAIKINIRDLTGVSDPTGNVRLTTLTNQHLYNLKNQGWTSSNPWSFSGSTPISQSLGSFTITAPASLPITLGDVVQISYTNTPEALGIQPDSVQTGNVTAYSGTSLTINVTSISFSGFGPTGTIPVPGGFDTPTYSVFPISSGFITTWQTAIGNNPSNSDVWWRFKNSAGAFSPGTTIGNITTDSAPAPRGHFVLEAFNQNFGLVSGVTGISSLTTFKRPKTGAWFSGRLFYSGVDDFHQLDASHSFITWTENIYFSKTVTTVNDFSQCYQDNDPTSENLFDILPTDGGVITIQGSGTVHKLFALQNGLLVFAANGVWFITGSQGIGFSATDYSITKISSVEAISPTSFVNVFGVPYFWNEDGIYTVQAAGNPNGTVQQGVSVSVIPITVDTIESFYDDIPLQSKKFARADFHPIDYTIQWVYRDTDETSVTTRYEFNRILNYNVYNKAFFPYTVTGTPHIHGVRYIQGPGGSTSPSPVFKYATSQLVSGVNKFTFSEENSDDYVDFKSFDGVGFNYTSYFITGYSIPGQALRKFQPSYIFVYSRNDSPNGYKIQGIWDYSINPNSGRWSSPQIVTNNDQYSSMVFRKHKIRGHGIVLQFKVSSLDRQPFDIMGWAVSDTINASV